MTETERAIEHFEYGISHDIFSEPVTTYAKLAVVALRDQVVRKNLKEMTGASCRDCGVAYGSENWVDTVLSDEQWALIFPEHDGILCANCIIKRASKIDGIIRADMRLICAGDINPKPLTLDELRERDGALVYCTYRRATKPGKPWEAVTQPFLVDAHRFMRLVGTDTCLSFDHWKTTWLAYDHPPKETTL